MFDPIFNTAPASSKHDNHFKNGQNRLENYFAYLVLIRGTLFSKCGMFNFNYSSNLNLSSHLYHKVW